MCDVIGVPIGDPYNRLTAWTDGQEVPTDRLEVPNDGLEAPNDCIRGTFLKSGRRKPLL